MRPAAPAQALALLFLVGAGARSDAQGHPQAAFDAARKETGWVDQIGPGGLVGWDVRGAWTDDKDGVHLGGPGRTTARLVLPGERLKVHLEYRTDRASVTHRFHRGGMFSGTLSQRQLPAGGGRWTEALLSFEPHSGGHRVTFDRRRDEKQRGVIIVAADVGRSVTNYASAINSIEIDVPPGQKLSIRKLRLLSKTPSPAFASPTLYAPLLVLAAVLLGVMGLGWLLHRRRPESAR